MGAQTAKTCVFVPDPVVNNTMKHALDASRKVFLLGIMDGFCYGLGTRAEDKDKEKVMNKHVFDPSVEYVESRTKKEGEIAPDLDVEDLRWGAGSNRYERQHRPSHDTEPNSNKYDSRAMSGRALFDFFWHLTRVGVGFTEKPFKMPTGPAKIISKIMDTTPTGPITSNCKIEMQLQFNLIPQEVGDREAEKSKHKIGDAKKSKIAMQGSRSGKVCDTVYVIGEKEWGESNIIEWPSHIAILTGAPPSACD